MRNTNTSIKCIVTAGALVAMSANALAQTCFKDHREVVHSGGSAKLRNYLCKVGDSRRSQLVRVTFLRLSDAMAGALVLGRPLRALRDVVGSARVIENEVYKETQHLFSEYGEDDSGEWSTAIDTPPVYGLGSGRASGRGSNSDNTTSKGEPIRFLNLTTMSDRWAEGESESIQIEADDAVVQNSTDWPSGYNQYYRCNDDIIGCTTIWKYIGPGDLDDIERDTDAAWKKIEEELAREDAGVAEPSTGSEEPAGADAVDPEPLVPSYKRHFAMFRHLAKKGWPEDFLVIMDADVGCGDDPLGFTYLPRPLMLDVAVVENLSSTPVQIDDFWGAKSETDRMRADSTTDELRKRPPVALGVGANTLPPQASIAVPLRILFAEAWDKDFWGETAVASMVYRKIRALKPGSLISEKLTTEDGNELTIKKRRESFLPPILPKANRYNYGPELSLSALMIDGKSVVLEGTSANFLNMTAASGENSCPYLYSWDTTRKSWLSHGKVIDTARERKNMATELVSVKPGTLRFKLAEEEPEVSYIDEMELRLTLSRGQQISLKPKQSALAHRDERFLRILAYRSEVIEFELPEGLVPSEIARSELAITGYYRRYSTLVSEIPSRERKSSHSAAGVKPSKSLEGSGRD